MMTYLGRPNIVMWFLYFNIKHQDIQLMQTE